MESKRVMPLYTIRRSQGMSGHQKGDLSTAQWLWTSTKSCAAFEHIHKSCYGRQYVSGPYAPPYWWSVVGVVVGASSRNEEGTAGGDGRWETDSILYIACLNYKNRSTIDVWCVMSWFWYFVPLCFKSFLKFYISIYSCSSKVEHRFFSVSCSKGTYCKIAEKAKNSISLAIWKTV